MADNQAVWLASVLMHNDDICEVIAPAGVHQLADDLHEPMPLSRYLLQDISPEDPIFSQWRAPGPPLHECNKETVNCSKNSSSRLQKHYMGRRLDAGVPVEADGHVQAA